MKQGYHDVRYLCAPHIRRLRPAHRSGEAWRWRVTRLRRIAVAGDATAVHEWFQRHYPPLMQSIPEALHAEFAEGVIERFADEETAFENQLPISPQNTAKSGFIFYCF